MSCDKNDFIKQNNLKSHVLRNINVLIEQQVYLHAKAFFFAFLHIETLACNWCPVAKSIIAGRENRIEIILMTALGNLYTFMPMMDVLTGILF